MKRVLTLLLAAVLFLGASTEANAISFKAKGEWIIAFDYGQNGNFTGGNGRTGFDGKEDEFNAKQRLRLQLDAIASESLSGKLYLEIGEQNFGRGADGGAVGADCQIVEVKRAFIDWQIPGTYARVRMGIQGGQTPSYALKHAQSAGDDAAALVIGTPFSRNISAAIYWSRPANDNFVGFPNSPKSYKHHPNYMDNVDLFGFVLNFYYDGFKISPWGMFCSIGPNLLEMHPSVAKNVASWSQATRNIVPAWGVVSSDGRMLNQVKNDAYAMAWWAGFSLEFTRWDPFRFALDFSSGGLQWANSRINRAGWLAAAVAEFKLDWGTPGIVGWYSTGDDDDLGNGSERQPALTTGLGDNDFSNYAFDGNMWTAREGMIGNNLMSGTWGIGVRLKDFYTAANLKHTFRVNYIGGTNDHNILKKLHKAGYTHIAANDGDSSYGLPAMYLTDLDSCLELGAYSEMQLYDNLKVALDANYIAMFLDNSSSTWKGAHMNGQSRDVRDSWNVNLSFIFEF